MNDHSDSGSSRLSDWALVNSQGELEGSDEDSNADSVNVAEREIKEQQGYGDLVSRETTPECIELEQLMRKADAAEREKVSEVTNAARTSQPQSVAGENESLGASSLDHGQLHKMDGACCAELLQSAERRHFTGEREEKVTAMRQLSQDSDSPASSTSILSISDISSLSTTSKSSRSDSDSESDFVRLEKESSCVSTESEGEEPMPRPRVSAMTTSGSSVGSGFNFLSGSRAASLEPPALPIVPAQESPPSPPVLQHQEQQQMPPQQEQHVSPEEQPELPPQHQESLQQQHQADRPSPVVQQPQPQQPLAAAGGADDDDADDGDTESSNEDQDQDDRIESEQSDDAHSARVDDSDDIDLSVLNDFGDLPLVLGDVERHYIHRNNQHINGYLNRVVLAVIVLALGMGLGHWIGSTHEHFSQLEIQLSQMKRLHLLQDKYVQCLAHNDELHLEFDTLLQKVTDRMKKYNQEESDAMALADLRNNNQELQKQLQEAQNQLEQVLASIARDSTSPKNARLNSQSPHPNGLQPVIAMAKLLVASEEEFKTRTSSWDEQTQQALMQARQSVTMTEETKGEKINDMQESTRQEQLAKMERLKLVVQEARQQINSLQNENAELKVIVGRMRYNADGVAGKASLLATREHGQKDPNASDDYSLPPPPNPIPPPPLVGDILEEATEEKRLRCVEPSDCPEEFGYDPYTLEKVQEQEISDIPDCDEDDGIEIEEVEDIVEEMQGPHIIVSANPQKPPVNAGTPHPVPVDVTLLQRNLSQEQQRADMWRRLYLSARAENRRDPPINGSACVQYLMQQMNVSALMHSFLRWNLTGIGGTEQFTDLTRLVASIVQLQRNLVDALPSIWEEISSTLHGFNSEYDTSIDVGGKERPSSWKEKAEKEEKSEEHKAEKNGEGSDKNRWSDSVKNLLNKTRGTLSNVSRQIQQTWGQVKDASRQLWPSNDSVLSRVAAHVKNGVSKLSKRVQKKASRWFKKRDKHNHKKNFEDDTAWEKSAEDGERKKALKHPEVNPVAKKDTKKKGKKFDRHADKTFEEKNLEKKDRGKEDEHHHKNVGKKDKGREDEHHHSKSHGKYGKKEKRLAEKKVRSNKLHPQHSTGRNDESELRSDGHFRKSHGKGRKNERKRNHSDSYKKNKKEKFDKKMKKAFKKRVASDKHHDKDVLGKHGKQMTSFNKHENKKIIHDKSPIRVTHSQGKGNVDFRPKWDSQHKETQFHTKTKDHNSHADKAVLKFRQKLKERYQNLFNQIDYLGQPGFNNMNKDDLANIRAELDVMFRIYNDYQDLGLPLYARNWLKCQSKWFGKAKQYEHLVYQPIECVQYLTPWQLTFAEETRIKLLTGECQIKLIDFCHGDSCIDPLPEFTEDHYKYVCKGDDGYDGHPGIMDDDMADAGKGKSSSKEKTKFRPAPKGRKEDDLTPISRGSLNADSSRDNFISPLQKINQTQDDLNAWYFDWLEGRDNLRAGELKADWFFERAVERQHNRHQEQTDNWIFERALNRNAEREKENQEEEDGNKNQWHGKRKDQHKHKEKAGREKKNQHEWKGDNYHHHHGRDFRQKYGRATFCDSC